MRRPSRRRSSARTATELRRGHPALTNTQAPIRTRDPHISHGRSGLSHYATLTPPAMSNLVPGAALQPVIRPPRNHQASRYVAMLLRLNGSKQMRRVLEHASISQLIFTRSLTHRGNIPEHCGASPARSGALGHIGGATRHTAAPLRAGISAAGISKSVKRCQRALSSIDRVHWKSICTASPGRTDGRHTSSAGQTKNPEIARSPRPRHASRPARVN